MTHQNPQTPPTPAEFRQVLFDEMLAILANTSDPIEGARIRSQYGKAMADAEPGVMWTAEMVGAVDNKT